MEDLVADILEQRADLESGPGGAVALSVLLHAALMGTAVYAALHQPPPQPVSMVSIRLAQATAPAASAARPAAPAPAPSVPVAPVPKPVETPKIQEPKPEPSKPVETRAPEKNTVPLSPFGRSTKKGSESPATKPAPASAAPATAPGIGVAADIPVGASGVTGLEGGDFPYTIYLEGMQRKIGGNWYRPQVQPGISAIVYFRIQRDGTLTDADWLTKSGNGTFDRQALSAVRSSSPLNPLPFGYNGTYLGVHLTFR